MKNLMCGVAMSFGIVTSVAAADQVLVVGGEEYSLSELTNHCQSILDDPAAQISCFGNLSKLIEKQSGQGQENEASVVETLSALQAAAQYQDSETGLIVTGSECVVQFVYYGNYFHISRRNVSTIDLFSAQFDASQLQYDQTAQARSGQALLSKGVMAEGATATTHGGLELDSSLDGFAARDARTTLDVYAPAVVQELAGQEVQSFDFVLVHPKKSQASAEIWSAFEAYVSSCQVS